MKSSALLIGTALALAVGSAWSDPAHRHGHHLHHGAHHHQAQVQHLRLVARPAPTAWARVVAVEPIYATRQVVHGPSCLRAVPGRPASASVTPVVLGAALGTAIGHSIGDAHGDAGAAALAGGLLGAAIGHDVAQQNTLRRQVIAERPCEARYHRTTRPEVIAYAVSYRYQGRLHHTRLNRDPGDWVKLDIDVRPV